MVILNGSSLFKLVISFIINVFAFGSHLLMRLFNVKRVFYTNDDGEFVCEKVKSDKLKNRLSAAFRSQNPGNYWRIKKVLEEWKHNGNNWVY